MMVPVPQPPPEEAGRACEVVHGVSQGRARAQLLPEALRVIQNVILAVLGCVLIPMSKVVKRPRIDTLLDGGGALIEAKARFDTPTDRRMAHVFVDTVRVKLLMTVIETARQIAAHTSAFLSTLMANLAMWEQEVHETMDSAYGKLEAQAAEDPELRDAVARMHKHLREAAERAAEQAEKNRDLRKSSHEAGRKEGEAGARREARAEAADEFRELAETLMRTQPDDKKR
jgi:hypothetical protein